MGLLAREVTTEDSINNQRFNYVMSVAKLNYLKKRSAIEVGSGDGTFAKGLLSIGYQVETIDVRSFVEACWTHHILDIENSSLPKKFDLVLAGEILEHLKKPDVAMQNIISMAKLDSLLFVSVPNFPSKKHLRVYQADSFRKFMTRYLDIKDFQVFGRGQGHKQFLVIGGVYGVDG